MDLMVSVSVENKGEYCCLKCVESWTFKNHVHFTCNSHTTTMCADPTSPGNMLAPSKTARNKWQLMRTKSKL